MKHFNSVTTSLVSVSVRGRTISAVHSAVRTCEGWCPLDFFSVAAPPGLYSVWEFLARTEPELFDGIGSAVEEFNDVLASAIRSALSEGRQPLEWPAPAPLAAEGMATVLLFPDAILRDVIPLNP